MAKKDAPPPVEPGDFQLDPKDFHTGNPVVDMGIGAAVKLINESDLNHDHKRDIAEYAPTFQKLAPLFLEVAQFVDVKGLFNWVLSHPEFFKSAKDKDSAAARITQIIEHVEELHV